MPAAEDDDVVVSFLVGAQQLFKHRPTDSNNDDTSSGTSQLHCCESTEREIMAGIARVDVYCKTGTVCTIRLVYSANNQELQQGDVGESCEESIKTSYSLSPSAVLSSLLPTPQHSNARNYLTSSASKSPTDSSVKTSTSSVVTWGNNNQTIVKRIFRRNVNIETLKRILSDPPTMNEIPIDDNMLGNNHWEAPNENAIYNTQSEQPQLNLSGLSKTQQRFLQRERKNHNRRMRREENARQKVAHLILSGGSLSDLKLDSVESKDTAESTGTFSSLDSGKVDEKMSKRDMLRKKLLEVQRKIELADMGIAIISGEVESTNKMIETLQKEQQGGDQGGRDDDTLSLDGNNSEKEQGRDTRNHPREGKQTKEHRGREGKKNTRVLSVRGSSSYSKSISTVSKRIESFSTYDDDRSSQDSESSSSASLDDSEAEEIARMIQGCEVEYSFPYDHHDELEDALLAQEFASYEDSDYSSDDDAVVRRGRGRHRCGNKSSKRRVEIPNIVAIPTNGDGCVVLRHDGSFNLVGEISKPMYKALFCKKSAHPEYIAMGTNDRFFIRFDDGTHSCVGPTQLKSFLKAKNSSRFRTVKQKQKKGDVDPMGVSSIAFGKGFEDFFMVRNDGSWECIGDMPSGLDKLLEDRRFKADLEWVSLGPNNEWCLKAKNGRIWWGGVSEEVDDHFSTIAIEDGLTFIDFGENDSFFLLHQ